MIHVEEISTVKILTVSDIQKMITSFTATFSAPLLYSGSRSIRIESDLILLYNNNVV